MYKTSLWFTNSRTDYKRCTKIWIYGINYIYWIPILLGFWSPFFQYSNTRGIQKSNLISLLKPSPSLFYRSTICLYLALVFSTIIVCPLFVITLYNKWNKMDKILLSIFDDHIYSLFWKKYIQSIENKSKILSIIYFLNFLCNRNLCCPIQGLQILFY